MAKVQEEIDLERIYEELTVIENNRYIPFWDFLLSWKGVAIFLIFFLLWKFHKLQFSYALFGYIMVTTGVYGTFETNKFYHKENLKLLYLYTQIKDKKSIYLEKFKTFVKEKIYRLLEI